VHCQIEKFTFSAKKQNKTKQNKQTNKQTKHIVVNPGPSGLISSAASMDDHFPRGNEFTTHMQTPPLIFHSLNENDQIKVIFLFLIKPLTN